ncbi:FAD-binding domain-containing protein [Thozetella sp. PMI_491]|nr:FAD-binding domain-containing protein [Thozetella sp. PMI_491]
MASNTFPILRRDSTSADVFQEAVWSRVFNHRRDPTRVPRAVVKPTTVEHIQKAVLVANEENCRVSIRSGGHSWAIWSVRNDAILIDLENFNLLEYNAEDLTVTCSPSTTGKQLIEFLATKGRSFPVGHMSDIGLGGFLLGANFILIGISVRRTGVSSIAATLKMRNYFGLCTAEGLACKHGDPDTECIIVGMQPPHSPVAAMGFVAFSFKESREEAQKLVDGRFANYPKGAVIENLCNPSTIPQASAFLDSTTPEGSRICADTAWLSDDSNLAELFMQALSALPSKNSSIIYMHRPQTDVERTAFLVTSHHFFSLYATWQDEADDEKCIDWVRKTYQTTEPFEVASAISDADFQARTYKFWSPENAQKVMSLRKKWDANGRFCGYLDAGDKAGVEGLKTRA